MLAAGRAVAQEAIALREAMEVMSIDPKPGCPREADWSAWPGDTDPQAVARRNLRGVTYHQAQLIFANAFDHMTSLGRLLGGDGAMPIYSHSSEARVACEAAVRFAWLLDPTIASEERIVRGAVGLLVSADEQLRSLKHIMPTTRVPRAQLDQMLKYCTGERSHVEQMIKDAGIDIVPSKNQKTAARLTINTSAVSVPLRFDVSENMSALLPDVPSFYSLSSGIVHSYFWMLRDSVAAPPTGPELNLAPDVMQVGGAALAAISASALMIGRCAHYYGHDPEPRLRANKDRYESVDQQMRVLGVVQRACH